MDTKRIADRVANSVIEVEFEGESRVGAVSLGSLKRSQGTLTAGELDRAMAMTLDSRLFENAFEKVMKSWNVEIRD